MIKQINYYIPILITLLLSNISLNAQNIEIKGRYLGSFDSDDTGVGYLPLDFEKDGSVVWFTIDAKDNSVFSHWKQKDANTIHLDFTDNLFPKFHSWTGDYKIEYKTHDVYALVGKKETIYLSSYIPEKANAYIKNAKLNGIWETTLESGTILTYEFIPPNIVNVVNKFSNHNGIMSGEFFFTVNEDESLTMYPVIMVPNAGKLEKIQINNQSFTFQLENKNIKMKKKN